MKIFFTASTALIEKDPTKYKPILETIENLGHINTNYYHFDKSSKEFVSGVNQYMSSGENLYNYVQELIQGSDALIAEITQQSIRVGFQLEFALNKKIPCLFLYKETKDFVVPIFAEDSRDGLITVAKYETLEDLKSVIKEFLDKLITGKIKFNFYINLNINKYLNQLSKTSGRAKSDIVRDLILEEMKKNPL